MTVTGIHDYSSQRPSGRTPGVAIGIKESLLSQAAIYANHLRDYHYITPANFSSIINSRTYNLNEIQEFLEEGRKKRLYPTLEKILNEEITTSEDESVMGVARKFGEIDKAYLDSVFRYQNEKLLINRAKELGFYDIVGNFPIIKNDALTQRNLIFNQDKTKKQIEENDFSRNLILPERFKGKYDFNTNYDEIQKIAVGVDENYSAESLLSFYNYVKKLGNLSDIVNLLDRNDTFSSDVKARKFVSDLVTYRLKDVFSLLRIEGVNLGESLPIELEHAYNRGIYDPKKLTHLVLSKLSDK